MEIKYNQKVKDFLEAHPDMTILGLFWAGYWRFCLLIIGISFGIGILSAIFGG